MSGVCRSLGAVFAALLLIFAIEASPALAEPLKIDQKMTMEALRKHVVPRLAKVPNVASVKAVGADGLDVRTKDKRTLTVGLGNLLLNVNGDVGAAEAIVANFIASTAVSLAPAAAQKQLSPAEFTANLMPIVRNAIYETEFNRIARKSSKTAPGLLARPFAGDMIFIVGLDGEKTVQHLQAGTGEKFGVSDDAMFVEARKNLLNKVSSLRQQEVGPVRMIDFDPDYNASLLVIDEVWSAVAPGREDDVVVAVPSRDVLVFGFATDPAAIEALRGVAATPGLAYPVSKQLFRRSGKGWVVFK